MFSPDFTIVLREPQNRMRAMHAQTYGDGHRIFIGYHGWGSEQGRSFKELLPFLPEDVTLIGVDLPGCGKSERVEPWGWEHLNDEVARHLDHLPEGKKVTLVGSCSGVFHALEVASRRPERIEAIIMLEPFAYMPWYFSIFLKPITGRLLYKMVFDNPLGKAATSLSMRKKKLNDDFDMVGSFGLGTDLDVAYDYLGFYGALTEHGIYKEIDAPIRIIHGQNTFGAIHESVAMWQENWPSLELIELEGVVHMLNQEAPEKTASAIFSSVGT